MNEPPARETSESTPEARPDTRPGTRPDARPAPSLKDLVGELATYVAFGLTTTATLPLVTASHLLHRGDLPRLPGRWVRRAGRTTATLSPLWDFAIEGTPPEGITSRPFVVVANHKSHVDPFLLSSLPWDMQWVAKEELFHTPLLGWIMTLGGDIALKRGSGDSVRAMFEQCRRALQGGLSVMLFPEGTRATKSGVQPFKDGAFELAIEQGVPILPIAIAGTERCMRKGSSRLSRARAIARILGPVATTGLTKDDVGRVRDETREKIVEGVTELEAKLA